MNIKELYASTTAAIIRDLESGVPTWVRPWKSGNPVLPYNHATGRRYSGINIPILWSKAIENGWPNGWLTYKQARAIDAQVRGGEKATRVVYTNKMVVGEGEDEKRIGYLKQFFVFNTAQIDGLPEVEKPPELTPVQRDDQATAFIQATKADIRHGGDRAFYRIKDDFIMLPEVSAFESYEHYLATCLHELCHFTGHPSRLNRQLGNRFGSKEYVAEELIAEFGAAFLCAHLGVEGRLRHAEYISNWLELLKDDERAVFTAASQASKAADFLRSFSEQVAEAA